MPFITRNDSVDLYYEVHGNGIPLILTHGYSATSAMWRGQINAFVSQGYKLIIWDMRGHGRSSYPDDQALFSEEQTVADKAAIIDHVCGSETPIIVGGLSLGGYMSLAFYRVHPQRVRALLIIDTGPGFKSDKARENWNKTARNTAKRFDEMGLAHLQSSSMSAERQISVHRDAKGLAMAARGMLAQRNADVIESLASIKVPALVVVGANDTPFLAASEYMERKIPGAKRVVVPDAGHAVNLDQPKVFNDVVIGFLSGALEVREKSLL